MGSGVMSRGGAGEQWGACRGGEQEQEQEQERVPVSVSVSVSVYVWKLRRDDEPGRVCRPFDWIEPARGW